MILKEFRAIKELLTPKPTMRRLPPPKRTFSQEFIHFLNKRVRALVDFIIIALIVFLRMKPRSKTGLK